MGVVDDFCTANEHFTLATQILRQPFHISHLSFRHTADHKHDNTGVGLDRSIQLRRAKFLPLRFLSRFVFLFIAFNFMRYVDIGELGLLFMVWVLFSRESLLSLAVLYQKRWLTIRCIISCEMTN